MTKQGYPIVVFQRNDYMVKLAESSRFTLIRKFRNFITKMDIIRKEFLK